MDMYELKWTRLQNEVFRLLCIKAGRAFNMREMAKLLKVSPTAVSKALILLEKEQVVTMKKSETMNLAQIELNRSSQRVVDMKKVENLKLIYESGLKQFLFDGLPGCTTILFGSYSRGEDINPEEEDQRSDIDIAVIGRKEKPLDLLLYEKLLEREININFYESWDKIHKHLRNNILNGIILNGSVDV